MYKMKLKIKKKLFSFIFQCIRDPKKSFKLGFFQALLMSFPWVKKYFSFLFDFQAAEEILFDIADLMEENIVKHQETLDVNEPTDYIDMVLIEIEKSKDSQSSFHGQLGLDNLKVSMFDLFLAGSETTSTTLTWAALYMVR